MFWPHPMDSPLISWYNDVNFHNHHMVREGRDERHRSMERTLAVAPGNRDALSALLGIATRESVDVFHEKLRGLSEATRLAVRINLAGMLNENGMNFEDKGRLLCPEFIDTVEQQYANRIQVLREFGVLERDSETGEEFITGVDEEEYVVSTLDEVKERLNHAEMLEKIGRIPSPTLFLVPFAMSLKRMAALASSHTGRMTANNPVFNTWDLDADINEEGGKEKLWYGVVQYDPNPGIHKGKRKRHRLVEETQKKGWDILVMDGRKEIDREFVVKEREATGRPTKYKNSHDFLQGSQEQGWDGLHPEDYLIAQMLGLSAVTGPFDAQNFTRLTGAYIPEKKLNEQHISGAVPNGGWDPDRSKVSLFWFRPEYDWVDAGFRAAVRG